MSEAKHTPGPWLRDRESGFDCDVRAANGRRVAGVNVQNPPKTKQQFDGRKAENEANARLIAAAPELLDALVRLKIEIVLSDVDQAYIEQHFRPWLDKAEKAIAKATQ